MCGRLTGNKGTAIEASADRFLAEISNRLKSCRDVGGITRRRVMATCEKCNLCEHPGTLSTAVEIAQIPCNVRKFRDKFFTIWRCTGCGSLHCKEDADLPAYYADYPLKQQ